MLKIVIYYFIYMVMVMDIIYYYKMILIRKNYKYMMDIYIYILFGVDDGV